MFAFSDTCLASVYMSLPFARFEVFIQGKGFEI